MKLKGDHQVIAWLVFYFIGWFLGLAMDDDLVKRYVDISEIIKNTVVGLSAIAGVTVALMGLNAWRNQLTGSVEYNLARKILNLVYKKRNALREVRRSTMFGNEQPTPPPEMTDKDERHYYAVSGAYQARVDKLRDVDGELDTAILEAEVIWGDEVKGLFEGSRRLENDVIICIRAFLRTVDPDEHESMRVASQSRMVECRGIMYESWDEEDDFGHSYKDSIVPIEEFFKEHLKR